MEIIALGGLIGLSVLGSTYALMGGGPNAFDVKTRQCLHGEIEETTRDISDAGDVYFMQGRPFQAANAQLKFVSEWYLPMSNPYQEPTYDLTKIIKQRAVNEALLESQAPEYIFQSKDTLGISYGAGQRNNGFNIGVPFEGVSFEGDPGFSLAKGAKVYIDRYEIPDISEYTNRYRSYGGEPTESLRAELPSEADPLITARNPYGPLGHYMQILRDNLFLKTAKNPDAGIQPNVLAGTRYKKPWNVRFMDQEYQPGPVYR